MDIYYTYETRRRVPTPSSNLPTSYYNTLHSPLRAWPSCPMEYDIDNSGFIESCVFTIGESQYAACPSNNVGTF